MLKNVLYSLFGQFFGIIISICSLPILGRLVTPEEFGVFGIIMTFQAVFMPFQDMGLTFAYLKVPEDCEGLRNSFFTIQVFIALINAAYLFLITPILVYIYNINHALIYLTPLVASIVIGSYNGQPFAILSREKRFDIIVKTQQASSVVAIVCSIIIAALGCGVWALIGRQCILPVTNFFVLRVFRSFPMRFVGIKTISEFKSEIKFGGELTFSRIVIGWLNVCDKLLLAKFYSKSFIGQYTKSQEIAGLPDQTIRQSMTSTAIAYLARQDAANKEKNYRIAFNAVLIFSTFPCLLLIVAGNHLMPLLLGRQWTNSGIYLQIMGFWGVGKILFGLNSILYQNEKLVRHLLVLNVVFLPISVAIMVLLIMLEGNTVLVCLWYAIYYTTSWAVIFLASLYFITSSSRLAMLTLRLLLAFVMIPLAALFYLRCFIDIPIFFIPSQHLAVQLSEIAVNVIAVSTLAGLSTLLLSFGQVKEIAVFIHKQLNFPLSRCFILR